MAALEDCKDPEHFTGLKIKKSPRNLGEFYPTEARASGKQAVIRISFLDDSWGNVRFVHVTQAFPPNPDPMLAAAAIQLVRSYAVTPTSLNGEPEPSWIGFPVRFILQGTGGPMGSLLRQDSWLALLDKANAGDAQSIVLAGYVAELVGGESGLSGHARLSLLLDSALQGAEFARLQLYSTLSACSKGSMVESWVSAGAKAGSVEAEMTSAQIIRDGMLATGTKTSQTEKLSGLLHAVAAGTDPFYRLWAAGLLATEPGLRDPATALKVAVALNARPDAGHEYDPDYGELLAAAQAANGQFAAAVQSELQAIGWARRAGWHVSTMESRLATYRAQRPWFGHLCDCQHIAPDIDTRL